MKVNFVRSFFAVLLVVLFSLGFYSINVFAAPSGATVTEGTPSTAAADNAGNTSAYAGNITGLTISGTSTTQAWQGYFGNVTGVIQLADSGDNVMYNWSLASPSGEVFMSKNSSITWTNIQCFNFTANGTEGGSGGETAGGVNLGGKNLSGLEAEYNIGGTDADGVNETFTDVGSANHDAFVVGSLSFTANECQHSTRVYGSTGTGVDAQFEEILMYEPVTASVVYTTLLENDLSGFDSATHDFEILVPEDGHSGDTAITTYYVFVELE